MIDRRVIAVLLPSARTSPRLSDRVRVPMLFSSIDVDGHISLAPGMMITKLATFDAGDHTIPEIPSDLRFAESEQRRQ